MAIYLLNSFKKGISSIQLAKELRITQKTAWHVAHKIRIAFANRKYRALRDMVEMDESMVGGKTRSGKRGWGSENKTVIFGMYQRNGNLRIMPVENRERATLYPIIQKSVKKGSTIYTDDYRVYKTFGRYYKHASVNHSIGEYVKGDVHTNSIENVWKNLKAELRTYHRPSRKHLHLYCGGFQFRWNMRKKSMSVTFDQALKQSNIRIKNKELIR